MGGRRATATLGGGCFWCIEAVFARLRGVVKVVSGYAGGRGGLPSYEEVCSGATGHAEVVQIEFDPAPISFVELYHQDYYRLNSLQPYCRMVIAPKLRRLQREFAARLKEGGDEG